MFNYTENPQIAVYTFRVGWRIKIWLKSIFIAN